MANSLAGTGVRINCISPGQIDVGVDLKDIDMRGMTSQLPPASLQSKEVIPQDSLVVFYCCIFGQTFP